MTTQLALSKNTHDLIMKPGGGIERVNLGRYTIQLVDCKLKTMLGEWKLNPSLGWIRLDDLKRNYDAFDIEMRARAIILATPGVKALEVFTLIYKNRTIDYTFKATTIYGSIDTTIPW